MTANEMLPAIGQLIQVRCEELWINCRVLDVKTTWNRPRLQVQPTAGNGTQWVELGRVCLISAAYTTLPEVKNGPNY